ncbi:sulfocyanin-like copper-binding protein [Pseudarthrobacter oxydans]|uniref:sulfocyanin-like copper-binding protein n=1 Tax=Pseudarthrobacter oxydans TaxID=1671 RepID=UPI002AA6DA57|nr:sulfocyanin-like copper-binding protein [Pseudarthrobacter oxydans]WPU09605.1 sulfocyanin-like copper-binding protein [Pseudarthrobacter oxydans]HET7781056.1 sulfocyanin-like copper-binding protein [Arthrobacter sp.]
MKTRSLRGQVLLGILAALVLTAASMTAIVFMNGGVAPGGYGFPGTSRCTPPRLPGAVIHVTASDMGGPMMGGRGMMRRSMQLTADRSTVTRGEVSFLVTNAGNIPHEMMIIPLADTQVAGTRPVGRDGKIDEAGSLAEAAATCAEGEGNGILPSAAGWITLDLKPGRYELFCNLPGHYWAGMYTQLTVT